MSNHFINNVNRLIDLAHQNEKEQSLLLSYMKNSKYFNWLFNINKFASDFDVLVFANDVLCSTDLADFFNGGYDLDYQTDDFINSHFIWAMHFIKLNFEDGIYKFNDQYIVLKNKNILYTDLKDFCASIDSNLLVNMKSTIYGIDKLNIFLNTIFNDGWTNVSNNHIVNILSTLNIDSNTLLNQPGMFKHLLEELCEFEYSYNTKFRLTSDLNLDIISMYNLIKSFDKDSPIINFDNMSIS